VVLSSVFCGCHGVAGGLTENDFIVAAHINELNLSELLQKRKARYWA
jgi:hypothetical protein